MSTLVLTEDQEAACKAFASFMMNSKQDMFVLKGYAGTGKTTLVKYLLDRLPNLLKTQKLLKPDSKGYNVSLTATTHKAAEALESALGHPVRTIHSLLGLVVRFNPELRKNELKPAKGKNNFIIENELIFIDEASFIGHSLLSWIRKRTQKCKLVFIGDPAQLLDVGSQYSPVFSVPLPGAEMTTIVRQAEGSPIIKLASQFRDVLKTGQFFSFAPDGQVIQHVDKATFQQQIEQEFLRPDWGHNDSKILTWTNKSAIAYNNHLVAKNKGTHTFQVDDYAVCNAHIPHGNYKNGAIVRITKINKGMECGIDGHILELDHQHEVFLPDVWRSTETTTRVLEKYLDSISHLTSDFKNDQIAHYFYNLADLRALFACTINKSQGSTYERVFIDLDDLRRCNQGTQLARLLYVAVSRARTGVIFTGDLA